MNIYQILTIIFVPITIFLAVIILVIRARFNFRIQELSTNIKNFSNELQKLDSNLKNQLKFIDLIFDNIPHGILLLDSQLRILRVNESLAALFYLDKEKIIGLKTIIVFNNINLEDLINKAFKELETQKDEITFYGEEDLNLEVDAIPLNFENLSLLVLFRNTTQEVEFAKLRSQFVANVSHEMRTPLTSIRGYIETLLDSDSKDKKIINNYLTKTIGEIHRLNYLIEDVLNLSNIEYKRNILIKQVNNIVEIIKECISSLSFLADKSDIKISFEYDKDPINFVTDNELFSQLVRNMIENTIFHGGEGINLKINLEEKVSNITLIFSDNGIGIDKQDLPFIFQRFYKGKNPFSKRKNSSGLGLSIVKHIIDLHKGSINVTSTSNLETKFTITFPRI
jgi:two-component system phosphate regulon sensor histidine kinase PhoR